MSSIIALTLDSLSVGGESNDAAQNQILMILVWERSEMLDPFSNRHFICYLLVVQGWSKGDELKQGEFMSDS